MDKLAPTEIRYPYAIVRACSELPYLSTFIEMPDGFLRVVLKIVQKINLRNPFSEIFASRQTLADEAGKSTDTVHRAIQWLEQNCFIERERKARLGLRGSRSPLVPTLKLLTALGLVDERGISVEQKKKPSSPPPSTEPLSPRSANTWQETGTVENLANPTDRDGRGFTRIGNVSLPTDLIWLCTKGLSPFAVLGLMKRARAASQRLSDVVLAARKYLDKLKSNQLYAYLQTLLGSGRDFSAGHREDQRKSDETRENAYLLEKSEIFEGRTFVSRKTGKTYQIESGAVRETYEGKSSMSPFTRAFLDAIEAGKLVPRQWGE